MGFKRPLCSARIAQLQEDGFSVVVGADFNVAGTHLDIHCDVVPMIGSGFRPTERNCSKPVPKTAVLKPTSAGAFKTAGSKSMSVPKSQAVANKTTTSTVS
ncbi:hypothetical protein BDR26DRAFT_901155 [Obelidium mucronatum]|nr:hypothetical protein BDR26DRAFT_901155 [Obelidium mucronatum]